MINTAGQGPLFPNLPNGFDSSLNGDSSMMRVNQPAQRNAIILLVVVSLLVLFSVVGLAFVLYSSNQAEAARAWREYQNLDRQGIEPDVYEIVNKAAGEVLFDVEDPTNPGDPVSSAWGHSMGRSMYGWDTTSTTQTTNPANTSPFSGMGVLRGEAPTPPISGINDEAQVIHYGCDTTTGKPRPERHTAHSGKYFNRSVEYTYPDLNNVYLAAIDMQGKLVTFQNTFTSETGASPNNQPLLSYYRPEVFGSLAPTNPNWTNAQGKYLILRPRKQENPNFPEIAANPDGSYTGDVENIENKPVRQNDAIWIDQNLPVRRWKGKNYKPLVAWTIIDLDGKLNVNLIGNKKGMSNATGSNQGYGPWEIDPANTAANILDTTTDMNALINKRNGSAATDLVGFDNKSSYPSGDGAKFYSSADFEANASTNASNARIKTPPAGEYGTTLQFDNTLYGNGFAELTNHPGLFNPYGFMTRPAGTRKGQIFGVNESRWLYTKFNENDQSFYTGSVLAETVTKLKNNTGSAFNPRWALTTISNDLDVAGIPTFQKLSDLGLTYQLTAGDTAPKLAAMSGSFPPSLDLTKNLTNTLSQMGMIKIARKLVDYRKDQTKDWSDPTNTNSSDSDVMKHYQEATKEREQFAQEIFDRLVVATGVLDTPVFGTYSGITNATIPATSDPKYPSLRWLAQLSVNMVDFIDNDNFNTAFKWDTTNTEFVFGVEQPNLLLSEAIAIAENKMPESGQTLLPPKQNDPSEIKIWVELVNPLADTNYDATQPNYFGTKAVLKANGTDVYKLWVLRDADAGTAALTFGNFGTPNFDTNTQKSTIGKIATPDDSSYDAKSSKKIDVLNGVATLADNTAVVPSKTPSSATTANAGKKEVNGNDHTRFFVIGPDDFPDTTPLPVSLKAPKMTLKQDPTPADSFNVKPTFVLQRLANPFLPAQEDPMQHNPAGGTYYNPYITVDFMEAGTITKFVHDRRTLDSMGVHTPIMQNTAFSYGKQDVRKSDSATSLKKQAGSGGGTDYNHSFFHLNNDGTGPNTINGGQPFDVYLHLDRTPTSLADIFNVPVCTQHELTYRFGKANSASMADATDTQFGIKAPYGHVINWRNPNLGLWRALSAFEVGSRVYLNGGGARVPGRVNINTIWDQKILQALAGVQSPNYSDTAQVTALWTKLQTMRTNTGVDPVTMRPKAAKPVRSFATPYLAAPTSTSGSPYAEQSGIGDTLLGVISETTANSAPDMPYFRNELFSKMLGNVTIRSNVFAAWATIGYFEVENEGPYNGTNKAKLGRELGTDDGTAVRSKFFFVIDRSLMGIAKKIQGTNTVPDLDPSGKLYQGDMKDCWSFAYSPADADSNDLAKLARPNGATEIIINVPAKEFRSASNELIANYDGHDVLLNTTDVYLFGVGSNTEKVKISNIDGANVAQGYAAITVKPDTGTNFTISHGPGTILHSQKFQFGNPGPQKHFNFNDTRFGGVVRYVEQLK
jgi:hypothetical protein